MADEPLIAGTPEFRAACVEMERRKCEASLAHYVRQAWPIVEPANELLWSWALDYICEHLEAVSKGHITRLVINIPPRTLKSTLASIMWPTWEWAQQPWMRLIFASHSGSLATKHSGARRQILQSEWYQERWGDQVKLTGDQNVKTWFENTKRGYMFATTIPGGQGMGFGGTRLIFDDPHSPDTVLSEVLRASVLDAYDQKFYPRLDDKRKGAIVLVMQRLHQNDLSGHVLAEQGWTHCMIDNPCQVATRIVFPMSGKVFERAEGDLIDPKREGPDEIAKMRQTLRAYGFSGQYLQRPSPPGGAIFKRAWFEEHVYQVAPPDFDEVVASVDAAFKGKADSDNTAIQVWGRKGAEKFLLYRHTEQMPFPDAKRAVKGLRARFPAISRIYIEDAANGPAIIDDLQKEVAGLIAVKPEGGKEARAHAVSAQVEAGNVRLPSPFLPDGNPDPSKGWVLDLIELAANFPKVTHDDDIDAMTQALSQMTKAHDAWADAVRQQIDDERRKAEPGDAARALFG